LRRISLVADASALISLASVSLLSLVLNEFNVVVSDVVVRELKEMSMLCRHLWQCSERSFEKY